MPLDAEVWTETLQEVLREVVAWLPKLVLALALLLLGWLVGRLIEALARGLLRRLGLDRLAERAEIARFLRNAGLESSASRLFGRVVFWLVFLVFLLAAVESLGLVGVVEAFGALLAYLPNVIAAALILLFGGLIARLAGDTASALLSQTSAGGTAGQLVRYVTLGFVLILAVEQLGIQTTLLTTAAVVLLGATALALALAFGFGSREIAHNIMAGFHAREAFVEGEHLTVRGHRGTLVRIGSVKSTIKTEAGLVTLPNAALVEEEVLTGGEADSA
jgi:small-conductance mechanosensitive channel